MKIIKLIDLVDHIQDDEGNVHEVKIVPNFMLPTIIDPYKIDSICPYFTEKGRLFKNVSIIKYDNDAFRVMGSPDYLWKLRNNTHRPFTGFYGKQEKETSKKRTQITSKPQRGTERSS